MKKFITLILITISVVMFSCNSEEKNVIEGRNAYLNHLKSVLKDPESLKIYNESISKPDDHTVIFTVDYGGKNGFGAMDRAQMKFTTVGGKLLFQE